MLMTNEQTSNKPTLQELLDLTGIYDKEIAGMANISDLTLRKMKQGTKVKAKMINRVIRVLNQELNTNYTIKDIDGLVY